MSNQFEIPNDVLQDWTVLAIDDDPIALEVITDILSHYGANVVVAKNGREGCEQARRLRPKFIISDISMPEMTGWEMVEVLKKDVSTKDIPIIALTAHAMRGDREQAISKGFHNYLTKPLNPFTFITQVMALLENVPEIASEVASRKG